MKAIKTLSAAFIAIVIFSSCQKEYSVDTRITGNDSSSELVKTYTEDITSTTEGHVVTTFNLSYDSDGRVTNIVSASSAGDKFVYKYDSDNTYSMDIYSSNTLSIHENFFINSIGLVDSTVQYNDTQDTTTEKYLYNASKQLVKLTEYNYSSATGAVPLNITDYEYDNSGNISRETDQTMEISYEYYPDLLNNLMLGQVYFFRNKNLPKVTTVKESGTTETLNHNYTFDSKNRLSTERVEASNGDVVIRTYTY